MSKDFHIKLNESNMYLSRMHAAVVANFIVQLACFVLVALDEIPIAIALMCYQALCLFPLIYYSGYKSVRALW